VCGNRAGRGVVAVQPFRKGDILLDYHGEYIDGATAAEIMASGEDNWADRRMNYLFCCPRGLFMDASAERCECHPNTRTLGRLLNFADGCDDCNVVPRFFSCGLNFTGIIFVAARDIAVLQELRYNYGDEVCLEIF
jgi:hypothetical protein